MYRGGQKDAAGLVPVGLFRDLNWTIEIVLWGPWSRNENSSDLGVFVLNERVVVLMLVLVSGNDSGQQPRLIT